MADVKVEIKGVAPIETKAKNYKNILNTDSNISNAGFKVDNNGAFTGGALKSIEGRNMLSWGERESLVFTSDGLLSPNVDTNTSVGCLVDESNPDMFVWGAVAENGVLNVSLVLKNCESLLGIVVYGDSVSGQYPLVAYIDNEQFVNLGDNAWKILFKEKKDEQTITFNTWSKSRYNACLTKISLLVNTLEFDKYNGLKSVESLSESTGQPRDIYYGTIANSGNISIIDVDKTLLKSIQNESISNSNAPISIICNGNNIQKHISVDSTYNESRLLSFDVSNELSHLANSYYKGYKNYKQKSSLYDIIVNVFSELDIKYDVNYIDNILLGNDLKAYAKEIIYNTPFVSYNTFDVVINNICNVLQCQLYQDNDGNIRFINGRPIGNSDNVLVIPQRMQKTSPQKDVLIKNKVKRVEYSNYKLNVEPDYTIFSKSDNFDGFIYGGGSMEGERPTYKQYYYESGASAGTNVWQAARIEGWVTEGVFEIPKTPNIQKVNGEPKITYSGTQIPEGFFQIYTYNPMYTPKNAWEDNVKSLQEYGVVFNKINEIPYTIENGLSSESITIDPVNQETKTLTISHNNTASITEYDDKYIVSYSILSQVAKYKIQGGGDTLSSSFAEITYVSNLTININGEYVNISLLDLKNQVGDSSSSEVFKLQDNELLLNNATINNINIGEHISNNIISDYSNGVAVVQLDVACLDVYDTIGNKVKNWANGQIIDVGDIVRVDKDNIGNSRYTKNNKEDIYFKVVGREFRYSGVPYLRLTLQEIKTLN